VPATTPKNNIAARMGRWSANHWKTATFGWLGLVVVAFALGMAGTKSIDPNTAGPRESGRMDRILEAGFKRPAAESVLVQSRALSTTDPAFKAAVGDVVSRLSKLEAVQNVRSGQVSPDGHSALVEFEIRGPADEAALKLDPVLAQVDAAQKAHPQLYVGEFGMASAVDALAKTVAQDLGKAGMLSLPITLVILVIAFGALIAAGIPLLLALTAVFATFGVVAGTSHIFPMANEAGALVLLIGLAVGVDYSLFYLKREREERAAGRSERAALEAAAATSGRSVLISGLTVMTAMAGMFLTNDPVFESFAIATIAVVAMAMIGSLTVLPALLSRLGDRVDRGRVPLVGRLRRDDGEGRIWGAIVNGVLRRPLLSVVLAGGFLVALAIPALQMKMVKPGPDTFPQSLPAVQTYTRMQQAFPGSALPASVVVKAQDVNSQEMQSAIQRLRQQALASGRMHDPITVEVNHDGTVAEITVPIEGKGTDSASNASLAQLRNEIVPATVGAVPGAEAGVTGAAAQWKDSTDEMKSNLPIVVGFVLLLAFSLMLVAFRSPVIAVKAIVLNLLSVAAAYGVLVLVFQHGYGSDFLGFTPTGGIDPVVPLLLFVILFGLSMDYHVFLLSRIREAVQRGATTDEAVAKGIKSTAGVVTSAAIVMVGVFAVFATLSMLMFKQFGVGLATAILIDATIVRGVLLPASMKLLGDWNWYLPRWLEWLPRFDVSESEAPAEAKPTPAGAPKASVSASAPRRNRQSLVRSALGALLLVAGVLGILDRTETYDISATVALGAGLGVVAGAIALGVVSRRRVRGLVPFGVVLLAAFAVAASSPVSLSAGIGAKDERPLQTRQLERSYEFGIGDFTVDLTDVALPPGTTKVNVELGIGDLLVQVPDHAALEIQAHADGGQVTVLGKTDDGTRPDEHAVVRGPTSAAPVLELDAEVGYGHLEVRRG
jgi:RND superfamily putative drug exporter